MELVERIRRRFAEILSPHFLGREQQSLVEMTVASLDEAQGIIDEGDAGLQEQINTLHSEYGAGLIGIEDTANNFLSFNVEGALAELATAGSFDPSETHIITGDWGFTNPVSFVNGAFSGSLYAPTLTGNRQYSLQDGSGTLAFLSDIPAPPAPPPEVSIVGGANVDVTGSFPSFTISVPNIPAQVNLNAGSNINITGTYPNLTISATGGSGGGDVTSVNGQVGDVVLTAASVGAASLSSNTFTGTQTVTSSGTAELELSSTGGMSGVYANSGNVTLYSGEGSVRIRPAGRVATAGELRVEESTVTWDGNTIYHSGNTHTHTASQITSGILSTARLGSGTANNSRFLRGDGTWAAVPAGNVGTVTSVRVTNSGSGLSFTGGPITSTGTITGTLSTNLQSWSGISPSSKANTNAVVRTSGNQTGIAGNKTFTGNITANNLTATSDIRLKRDIESSKARQKLLYTLQNYRWKWKESGEPGIGVLAQEVQKVAPEYVLENEEGTLSVDKAGLALEMVFALIDKLEAIDGSSD